MLVAAQVISWGLGLNETGKLRAEHLGLLQPAVALGNAALLQARPHRHGERPMKPWPAPLAAGCNAEGGSRLPQSMDFVSPSVVRFLILLRKQSVAESDLVRRGCDLPEP